MRSWNRAKLLWGYLSRQTKLKGLPVEYIVETTAKCNLYCPMCPRETHKQPKEDMTDAIFERHNTSTLLSTNGTFLDERMAQRLLATPLQHITLSFDGATKESFEFYRKGARFEKVRDNFVRFARLKKERGSSMQVVVQMVRMERNAGEVDDFIRFWKAVPGVDQVRIKEDETNLMRPDAGHEPQEWKHPCHYLWRGPMYVKHNGDVYPCCQSYMLDGKPVGAIGAAPIDQIWNGEEMQRMRRLHVEGRAGEIDICSRCCTTIPHPALVAGSLIFHGKTVRRLLPIIERLTFFSKARKKLLNPPGLV